MAEFKDVIQNWHKMCEHYFNDPKGCEKCPLFKNCDIMVMTDEELKNVEETVMNFNPEAPIYPTILELIHYIANRLPERKDGKVWARDIPISDLVMERIPYEVAEEFGLLPINMCGLHKYVDEEEDVSEWR